MQRARHGAPYLPWTPRTHPTPPARTTPTTRHRGPCRWATSPKAIARLEELAVERAGSRSVDVAV
ncbi:hypothetical protein, partial [Streptomyces sp. NPDC031705]|uniref:hypothetical protein n=1 Tax=Streptomyces sp. NPDC031705 TaxID=3155729 RepID=UPI0033E6C02E